MIHFSIIVLLLLVAYLLYQLKNLKQSLTSNRNEARELNDSRKFELQQILDDNQTILNSISDALLIINSDLEIKKYNNNASEIFRNQNLNGRSLSEVVLQPTIINRIQSLIKSKILVQERVILPASSHGLGGKRINGETAWIISVNPISNKGKPLLFCLTLRDVSTEIRSEKIRKDFVANASHEIRTPLTIINGYIENLIEDDILNDPALSLSMLKTIHKNGKRLERLVDDMLVISSLESKEMRTHDLETFDLIACANEVIEQLKPIVSNSQTLLKTHFSKEKILFNGVRFSWNQILFNLLENAIKQNMNRDIVVHFRIKHTSTNQVKIIISDNGIGIPSSHIPFIFNRFYRVEKHHTQSEIKGTGLGLSIVKRAVEAHKGTIEVSSEPGINTRFSIVVPNSVAST